MADETETEAVTKSQRVANAWLEVAQELRRAMRLHAPMHSGHEGYAVILEELDELWEAVRRNDLPHAREEAIQIAAMAVRFCVDVAPSDLERRVESGRAITDG